MTTVTVIVLAIVEKSTIWAANSGLLLYSWAMTALLTDVGMADAMNSAWATMPSKRKAKMIPNAMRGPMTKRIAKL